MRLSAVWIRAIRLGGLPRRRSVVGHLFAPDGGKDPNAGRPI